MAQAEAFETDFWKDDALRKSWTISCPASRGGPCPMPLHSMRSKLLRSVGDLHPLYFDEDYAARSRHGGLIAPPAIHILLMFACTPLDARCAGPAPSTPDRLELQHPRAPGRVRIQDARSTGSSAELPFVVHDNVFFDQRDEVIFRGRGRTIRPL